MSTLYVYTIYVYTMTHAVTAIHCYENNLLSCIESIII